MSYPVHVGLGVFPAQVVSPYYFDGTKLVSAAAGNIVYANSVALAATTWTTLVPGIPGYRFYIVYLVVTVSAQCEIIIRPVNASVNYLDVGLLSNTPVVFDYKPVGFNAGVIGAGIEAYASVAATLRITILYQAVPVAA